MNTDKKPIGKVKRVIDKQTVEIEMTSNQLIELINKRPEMVENISSNFVVFLKKVYK